MTHAIPDYSRVFPIIRVTMETVVAYAHITQNTASWAVNHSRLGREATPDHFNDFGNSWAAKRI